MKIRNHSDVEKKAIDWLVTEKPGGQFLRSLHAQHHLWKRGMDPAGLTAKYESPFTDKQWACLLKTFKQWLERKRKDAEIRKLIAEIEGQKSE